MTSRPRLLFIADLRSPLAGAWIGNLAARGWDVAALSTYPAPERDLGGPVDVQHLATSWGTVAQGIGQASRQSGSTVRGRAAARVRTSDFLRSYGGAARGAVAAFDVRRNRSQVQRSVDAFRPDLIHALRIPYEGITAVAAATDVPVIVSVWGLDFTYMAPADRWTRHWTRRCMQGAGAVIADCVRDQRLAVEWGFDPTRPSTVLASGGGVDLDLFHAGPPDEQVLTRLGVPAGVPLVFNPRGYRGAVRTAEFWDAMAIVLGKDPDVHVACADMEGVPSAESFVAARGLGDRVHLLPVLDAAEMAELLRAATVAVSPRTHDGTPNSLLETMASGCLPVSGDIESVREWITPGDNGLLWDLSDGPSLADEVLRGLSDQALRQRAAEANRRTVAERASREVVTSGAEAFYREVTA